MTVKHAIPGSCGFRDAEALYHSAFPAEERIPFSRMALVSLLRPAVDLLSYYEEDIFCGFSFTVRTDHYLYISYIAVNPELRSGGYGTKILAYLGQKYPEPMICDVKLPQKDTPDYETDLRRVAFWEKNGFDFFGNQYVITNSHGVTYLVCSTASPYDRRAYQELFDHLSLGPKAQMRIMKRKLKR